MEPNTPRRRWNQLHLSTMVVLALAAGVVMYLIFNPFDRVNIGYGFPIVSVGFVEGVVGAYSFQWDRAMLVLITPHGGFGIAPLFLAIDFFCCIGMLLAAVILAEWVARRNPLLASQPTVRDT